MIIPLCDIPCWLNQASAKIVELGTKTISVILINIDDGRRA